MVVDRSDFKLATYSVVSSIGLAAAVASVTGVGGICGGGPADCVRLQAATASAAHIATHAALDSDMTSILSMVTSGRPQAPRSGLKWSKRPRRGRGRRGG